MSWYFEYDGATGWLRLSGVDNEAPGSGPYNTEQEAKDAVEKRVKWACSSSSSYRVVQQRDTVPVTSKQEQDPKALQPKKPAIQYVPVALIAECAEALAEGRLKYGVAKWRETETEAMTYLGGALRHIYSYIDGEDIDPDSITGKTHLAGAIASLAILVDCIANGTIVDNRPPKGPGAKLMRAVKK